MENVYGIGTTNRYQLFLNEDEDLFEVLKTQEKEKELKKKSKLSEKENKGKQQETKGKTTVTSRKGIKETQNIKSLDQQHKAKDENVKPKGPPRAGGSERRFNPENREERNNQRNRPDKPTGGDFHREDRGGERRTERRQNPDQNRGDGEVRGRGTGRGMGRGRGRGGRPGGFDGRGKREFDRQSGSDKTGIKAVDKKEGAGAHNWGSHREAIEDLENVSKPTDDSWDMGEKAETEAAPPADATDKENAEGQNGVASGEEGEAPVNVEEERKELTLDEWKALKGNRSKPTYNLRKAGEGEDLSQWKKMYALSKKKEEEDDEEEEEEYDSSDYPQRVGRQKHVHGIEFTFGDSRIGRGGRGGRGGSRGAPRGGPRPPPRGNSSDNAPGPRDTEREPGTYGGPRSSRPSANKSRDRERVDRDQAPNTFAQRQQQNRQTAPKVNDEHDFPSLG